MLQLIGQKRVYIVDFDTMPELPNTELTAGERIQRNLINSTYAEALTDALEKEIITPPGKYGIYLDPSGNYEIFKVIK